MRKFSLVFLCLLSFVLCSCSGKKMGWSVLLWNLPEKELQDGDIVPVYIRSNISHVYVIGTSSGKIEVPLWQLTDPVKKGRVVKVQKKYEEFKHTYASVALDGLPMRAEPVNTAKQVYRLRKNENIKVLYKGNGQAVMAGKNALEGSWLRVLTSDGTQGWCFSYNLRLYETDKNGQRIGGEEIEEIDTTSEEIENIISLVWYPESYKAMVDSGRVDIEKINTSYNFHMDMESKKLSFTMPEIAANWVYSGASKTGDNQYKLNDIPVVITVRRSNFIVVRYTGESGKPEDFNLVTIEQDLNELVENEFNRRESEYETVFMFGPRFKSQSYGILELKHEHTFVWNNNRTMVGSIISQTAKNYGKVETKYFISRSLLQNYDGVITFKFEGMEKEVNFLYKMSESGLHFVDATGATIKNNILMDKGRGSTTLFFTKSE